jgi:hypothetical protein
LVLAGTTAGLELHRILDIRIQAVAHGQDIREYRKLKKRCRATMFIGVNCLINALAAQMKCYFTSPVTRQIRPLRLFNDAFFIAGPSMVQPAAG